MKTFVTGRLNFATENGIPEVYFFIDRGDEVHTTYDINAATEFRDRGSAARFTNCLKDQKHSFILLKDPT